MNKFIISVGNTSPSVTDQLTTNNKPQDITGATIYFKTRAFGSATLKTNQPALITGATVGEVRYDWQVTDVDTEGEYRGWWSLTLAGGRKQDSPEFAIIFDAHSEGVGTTEGPIAEQARQLLPVTWDALSEDGRYGDRMLRQRTDYVKFHLFATIVNPVAEATVYNPLITDYAAKCLALQIIPAGVEYWMEQHISRTTSGTNESVSYPSRIASLQQIQSWLTTEVASLRAELQGIFAVRRKANFPLISDDNLDFRTPDPHRFPKQTDLGWGWLDGKSTLPWSPF